MPEICDDGPVRQATRAGLVAARGTGSTGLFLSETDDPLWRIAHNILMLRSASPACAGTCRGWWTSPVS